MSNFASGDNVLKVVCCYCVKMRLQMGKGYLERVNCQLGANISGYMFLIKKKCIKKQQQVCSTFRKLNLQDICITVRRIINAHLLKYILNSNNHWYLRCFKTAVTNE